MLVDSHCHLDRLDFPQLGGDLDTALERAREQGVTHFLCVCIDMENQPVVLELARRYERVFASVGVHPNEQGGREPDSEELIALASDPRVVAIGETGLDYFRGGGDVEWQRERFRRHIAAAKSAGKPLIVHSREARADTLRILREENARETGGVMHCFCEDWDTARQAMDMGFYISFSGIVTFKGAEELRQVAKQIPDDRLLVETDAPYLAPVPFRGKTNQPAYVSYVARQLADTRGASFDHIAEVTTRNFFNLFKSARP